MGIVKISETLHDDLRLASLTMSRSINAQAEHWIRIGMLCETHPSAQNMAHVLAVADQVTVSAIVATYCLNEVADYVHEQRRRAAAHPTA